MRNARGFVDDYRRKGYPDDRIRIIASMRPEPLRSEALQILDAEAQAPKEPPPAGHEDVGLTTSERPAVQADEVTAVIPPSAPASAPAEAAPATPHPDLEALRQEVAAARDERDRIAADFKKSASELSRARASLAKLASDNAELPALRKRVGELEAALAAKETLLAEKDTLLSEKETSLAEERAERAAAAGRVEELTAALASQGGRAQELDALHQQLTGADAELEELRAAAAQLKQGVEEKCQHIAELQTDVSKTRDEAGALRAQIESNEKAVGQLQDKLTAREAELASLRAHFDREASDLKKRADQEMWIVRRRLRRLQKGALLGGAVAACFIAALMCSAIGNSRQNARLTGDLSVAGSRAPGNTGLTANQMPPQPVHPAAAAPLARGPARPQPAPVQPISWSIPPVSEPARDNAAPPPVSASNAPRPPQTLNVPAPGAPRPAATKVVQYKVQNGDNLWTISQKVLGRGEAWREIARQNNISVTRPDVHEGMTLTITVPASN